ncbi:glycosyltransferase [Psychrobacillus sp. FSL H8-0484]|uniref:glycosyltransferase n=1 Tax=Psychrobacillus sp. FSL H8-0484 TaxID=2921390 RepID=UPI0030F71B81
MTSAHERYDIRIFEKECKSLASHGYDVSLIVNDQLPNETVDQVKIISTNFKPKSRLDRMLNSKKKIFKKAVEVDADIYHYHDPELMPIGNKLKKRGKKVIFDSHENYTIQIKGKEYIPKFLRNIFSKIYYVYETYSIKRIDAVVFPCTYSLKNPFENRAKKTAFIDNFPMLHELYDRFNENEVKQKNTVCHIGTLTYDRGITHNILAAYKSKVNLILGGVLSPNRYLQEVSGRKEFSCVEYRGHVNREEVTDILRKSRIGLCTILNVGQYNKGDHFATKVYEYMAMGLPVIITDFPYAREELKRYKFAILVDPENVDEITEAILYLLKNPEIAKEMGGNGRLAVKEKYNWSIEEQKLIALYNSL